MTGVTPVILQGVVSPEERERAVPRPVRMGAEGGWGSAPQEGFSAVSLDGQTGSQAKLLDGPNDGQALRAIPVFPDKSCLMLGPGPPRVAFMNKSPRANNLVGPPTCVRVSFLAYPCLGVHFTAPSLPHVSTF